MSSTLHLPVTIPPAAHTDRDALVTALRRAHQFAAWDSSRSLLHYLRHVVIDSRPEPALYRDLAEPWQWTVEARMAGALEDATGIRALTHSTPYAGPRRFWWTLPRGHDKSSSIGRRLAWALAFSRRSLRAIAAAADKEQAGFIAQFMQAEARLNPWLADRLVFRNNEVRAPRTSSILRILAADEFSSYGLKEDIIVLDELTHWRQDGLWNAIVSGLPKRPTAVLVVITNAGLLKSWQHQALLTARAMKGSWYVYESPGRIASWMDLAQLEEARRLIPAQLARRLYDNVWIDPTEEWGFVTLAEAMACCDPSLPRRESAGSPQDGPFVGAIDYAPVKDRTVLCVGHRDDAGCVVLDRMDVLQGSPGRRVSIEQVERWIEEVNKGFPGLTLVVDEYQMESTIQKYSGLVDIVRFAARGGKANHDLASNLRSLILQRKVSWYPQAGALFRSDGQIHLLEHELSEVIVRPMAYGFRIDHERSGHDDRVVALGMMALQIVREQGLRQMEVSERFF